MEKIAFIVHGQQADKTRLQSKIARTAGDRFSLSFYWTAYSGHAVSLVAEALADKPDYLIAVGGDGTLSQVANGLVLAGELATLPIFGVLPHGTGNDFARTLGLTRGTEALMQIITKKHISPLDVGRIEYRGFDSQPQVRYFINMADIGVGADTVKRMMKSRKRLGSNLSFTKAALQAFSTYQKKTVKIITHDFVWEGPIVSAVFANGKYFGSGLAIAPAARPDDGLLDVTIAGDLSILHFIRHIPTLRKAKRIHHRKVQYHRLDWCRVESNDFCPLEIDGEYIGTTPFEVSLLPARLRVLIPQKGRRDF